MLLCEEPGCVPSVPPPASAASHPAEQGIVPYIDASHVAVQKTSSALQVLQVAAGPLTSRHMPLYQVPDACMHAHGCITYKAHK